VKPESLSLNRISAVVGSCHISEHLWPSSLAWCLRIHISIGLFRAASWSAPTSPTLLLSCLQRLNTQCFGLRQNWRIYARKRRHGNSADKLRMPKSAAELFRTVQKLRRSAHRFSRNLGEKVFLFGPLAAEWRTAGGANSAELWQKWSSFSAGNLVKIGRSAAEIFEVKRNSNFPVQNMKILYAPPPVLHRYISTIDRVV